MYPLMGIPATDAVKKVIISNIAQKIMILISIRVRTKVFQKLIN
jgi:hypothetical protein